MRLQLITAASAERLGRAPRLAAAAAASGLLLVCVSARAEDRVDVGATYFLEPAAAQQLHVVHPQLDAHVDLGTPAVSLDLGYNADIVTGATPRTYGKPTGKLDAISSATHFSDVRHAFHGGLEVRVGRTELEAGYTFAFENDYRSHAIDAAAKVDLWGKNTTFKLGYAHNFDSVCDADNRGAVPLDRRALSTSSGCFNDKALGIVDEALAIDSYFASWTQVLTPILVSDLSVGLQVLDGFQSNPYRLVRLFNGTVEAQESEPSLRQRFSVQGRLRIAVRRVRGALGLGGRFYDDSWGVKSGTAELTWEQYLVPTLLVRLRGRFYQQTRAVFYRDAGEARSYDAVGPVGQYFTGDRELSPFRDYLVGVKVSYLRAADERGKVWRVFEALDLNLKVDAMKYEALTPLPPNLARSQAPIGALMVQAGLSLRW
jgi:hypothetical protein